MLKRLLFFCILATGQFVWGADPIINASAEQQLFNPALPDGGLPPLAGVQNIQVFRASHASPDTSWTYNHHMDMAQWHGRMYIAWTNGQKDEDTWPAHEVYSSSSDGFHWTKPAALFPLGVSTSLRMYFFHSPSGRMLAIAGLRINTKPLTDAAQGGLVVREILADHTLGPVYTLIDGPSQALAPQPHYINSPDADFVTACNQLLADHTFLEQQDMGVLLAGDRMSAYQNAPGDFGRAFCFFHRADGALVGIAKKAWTVVSLDNGKTWSKPVKAASIHTDSAKEWVQRTSDGKFAFVFNPQEANRFPLVAMTSSDGITFSHMRVINGEVPEQRYPGAHKNIGMQYVRGISEWASDGTTITGPGAKDMWIVYSSNKEDIWVARIPVPLNWIATDWSTYSPLWSPVTMEENTLTLQDGDPYDFAKAVRSFPKKVDVTINFKLLIEKLNPGGELDVDLQSQFGDKRPARLALTADQNPPIGKWMDVSISADTNAGTFSTSLDGSAPQQKPFCEPSPDLAQLVIRTGAYRGASKLATSDVASDQPIQPSTFQIKDVEIH